MIGVITEAVVNSTKRGVIEIVDPEIPFDPTRRQSQNLLAGRYWHFAGVAKFAGLNGLATEFIRRSNNLVDGNSNRLQLSRISFREELGLRIYNRRFIGHQWNLSESSDAEEDIWFYQAFDQAFINQILSNQFPEVTYYSQETIVEDQDNLVESI